MSKPWASSVLGVVAGAMLVIGVVASVASLSSYRLVHRKLMKATSMTERLDELEARFAEQDALLIPFAGIRYDALIAPETLINTTFGKERVGDIRRERDDCDAGYVVNRVEADLKDVKLETFLSFIRTSESLRPPLRVVGWSLRASSVKAGIGDVVLKLERIEKHQD